MTNIIGVGSLSITDVNDALITTDGKPPRNPSEGMLWIDDSGETSVLKVYHNGTWEIQHLDVNNLDPDLKETIETVLDTLGTIADDGKANFNERKRISQEVSSIIGELPSRRAGNVYTNTLPTHSTLDSRGVGSFASIRENARNATIGTDESVYIELRQAYDALNSYLSAQTPKLWDITDANKHTVAVLTDPDTFREVFLDYYMAELRLSTKSEKRAQEAMREYTDSAVSDVIVAVDVEYSKNSSATTAPTSGWQTSPPTWENGKFIWSRTITNYKNGDTHITDPVNITGATGESGIGTDGRSVSNIQEQYYLSNSATSLSGGSWVTTPPTWQDGKFMWTRSVITFANPSGTHTTDPVSVTGSRGEKGEKGDNAPIVKLSGATQIIKVDKDNNTTPSSNFTVSGSAVNTSISSWQYSVNGGSFGTSAPTGVSRSGSTVTINPSTSTFNTLSIRVSDGTMTDTFTIARAVDGTPGTDGAPGNDGSPGADGTNGEDAYTVVLTNESHTFAGGTTSALAGSTSTSILAYKGTTRVSVSIGNISGMPSGMSRSISNNNTQNASVTFSVTASMSSSSGTVTIPLTIDGQSMSKTFSYAVSFKGTDGKDGTDGKGIQSTSIDYQLSSSGTSEPTGSWSTSIPTPVKGQYLWVRTRTTYTDSSVVTTYNVSYFATDGQNGADGNGVSSTEVRYQISTSGTTVPTGTWSSSLPTPIKGRFLWTRTVITYTNGTSSTAYSTSYYATDGAKGDKGDPGANGVSVTSVDVEYYLSTSATALSGGSWVTTAPTWIDGRFMWTRTKTTYSSGNPTTTDPVSISGAKGDTGSPGRSISNLQEQYYLSTSRTTQTGGSWVNTAPTWQPGRYMWTRILVTYANPSGTSTTTPVIDTSWEAIDGIEVGGVNLIAKTKSLEGFTHRTEDTYQGLNIARTTKGSTGYHDIFSARTIDSAIGTEYTVSFYAKASVNTNIVCHWYSPNTTTASITSTGHRGSSADGNSTVAITTEWNRYWVTWTQGATSETKSLIVGRNTLAPAGTTIEIAGVKLERGNKNSEWTEAPEDTDEKIENVDRNIRDEAERLQSNFDSYIEETAEAIYQYVGETHLSQTDFTQFVENINTSIEQTSTSWQLTFENTLIALGDEFREDIESANEANKYIRMEDGRIILGQEGSNSRVEIGNNRISFMQGGREIAYISNQTMEITHGIFVESAIIGEHKIETLEGGHTVFSWINE